jgi:hypothetical protein
MRRSKVLNLLGVCTTLLGLALAAVFTNSSRAIADQPDTEASKIRQGFLIAPVPLNAQGRNQALVGLGSYIVNAQGGCNDCHTNPPYALGGNPFLGQPKQVNTANYLAGGMQFGPFTSRNITPAANGLPAGLTLAQFTEVVRHGTDFKHLHPQISPLLQVMPWPVYQSMTDRDIQAMYEYLSSIPHAEPAK